MTIDIDRFEVVPWPLVDEPSDLIGVRVIFNAAPHAWDAEPQWSGFGIEYRYRLRADGDVEPDPVAVMMLNDDGLKPSHLPRVAWARWGRVAYAYARLLRGTTLEMQDELRSAKKAALPQTKRSEGAPGRRGHPDEFYSDIAVSYTAHAAQGDRKPTQRIADAHDVSRNTAAGWIRTARKKGFLPPATPGRSG